MKKQRIHLTEGERRRRARAIDRRRALTSIDRNAHDERERDGAREKNHDAEEMGMNKGLLACRNLTVAAGARCAHADFVVVPRDIARRRRAIHHFEKFFRPMALRALAASRQRSKTGRIARSDSRDLHPHRSVRTLAQASRDLLIAAR
jgi:hypothetical protein